MAFWVVFGALGSYYTIIIPTFWGPGNPEKGSVWRISISLDLDARIGLRFLV